jgi:hypothetical protein
LSCNIWCLIFNIGLNVPALISLSLRVLDANGSKITVTLINTSKGVSFSYVCLCTFIYQRLPVHHTQLRTNIIVRKLGQYQWIRILRLQCTHAHLFQISFNGVIHQNSDFQHWFKCPCPDKSFTAGVGRQWKQDNGDVDKYQ